MAGGCKKYSLIGCCNAAERRCDMTKTIADETKIRALQLNFQEYIPFLLNAATGRFFDRNKLDPRGMPLSEWRVLAVLWSSSPLKFGHLAQLTALPPSTLSRVLNNLERDGLVVRAPCKDDARAVTISPTQSGLAEVKRIFPHAQKLQRIALAGFSADEAEFLIRMLKRVYENVDQSIREIEARDAG